MRTSWQTDCPATVVCQSKRQRAQGVLLTEEGSQQVAIPEEALLRAAGEGGIFLAVMLLQLSSALLRERQVSGVREVQALASIARVERLPQQSNVPATVTGLRPATSKIDTQVSSQLLLIMRCACSGHMTTFLLYRASERAARTGKTLMGD